MNTINNTCKALALTEDRAAHSIAPRARGYIIKPLLLAIFAICLGLGLDTQAANRTWQGIGANTLWSNPANWDGGLTAPVSGDNLLFTGGTALLNTNNIAGLSLSSIAFSGGTSFALYGSALTINNGILDTFGGNTNNIILTLGASQSVSNTSAGTTLALNGAITNGIYNLSVGSGGGNVVISGAIGNGPGSLIKQDVGTLLLTASNSFGGGLTINGGTVQFGNVNAIPNGAGQGDVTIASGAILDLNGLGGTINGLYGAGTVDNITGTGTYTLTVGANSASSGGSFSGTIQNQSGLVLLNKTGANTLTLNGANTYTGPTTISQGTLALGASGSISSTTNISISSGAVFDTSAAGGFTLSSGYLLSGGRAAGFANDIIGTLTSSGIITIFNAGAAGTLTLGSGLTLNGGKLNYDLQNVTTAGAGVNDLIAIHGPLNINSPTAIVPGLLSSSFGAGNYTLISGATSITGLGNLNMYLPRGVTPSFSTASGSVLVSVSGTSTPASLVWTGGAVWDVQTTQNWLNNGVSDYYYDLDSVRFDDTSGDGNVSTPTAVSPGSIVISNSTATLTFAGPSPIGGSGSLTKSGTAQLSFDGPANTFTGPTVINGGILFLDWRTQLSLAPINNILYGGTVTNSLTLNNGSQLQLQSGGGIAHAQFFSSLTIGTNVNSTFGPGRTAGDAMAGYYGQMLRTNAGGVIYMNMVQRDPGDITGEWAANPVGPIGGYAVKGGAPSSTWAAVTTTAQLTNQYGVQGWINGYVHNAGESGPNAFLTNSDNVDVTANISATNSTVNSIRFNSAGKTVTFAGTNIISNGGILAGTSAGTATMTGGAIRSGNGLDLIIQQQNSGQALIINSVIQNNGGATNLTKAGPGLVALSAANTYNGTTYILEGTVQLGNGGTSGSIANMTNIVDLGTLAYSRSDNVTHSTPLIGRGGFATFGTGVLTVTPDLTYQGITTIGNGASLQLGNGGTTGSASNSSSITIGTGGNIIFNRSNASEYDNAIGGAGSLSKAGAGTLTLQGILSYAGNTTVTNGSLVLGAPSSLTNSATITVGAGATLDTSAGGGLSLNPVLLQNVGGSGSVVGPVTLNPSTKILPGGSGNSGIITLANDLSFNGGSLTIDISTATNDSVNVLGTATATSGTIQLNFTAGAIANKTYTLITTPNIPLAGSVNNLTLLGLPPTQVGVLSNDTKAVYLVVSASTAPTLTWRGDGLANLWDINTTANWISNGVASVWLNNQFAILDDTGSNNVPLNLVGALLPYTLTVNGTKNYTLAGSGKVTSAAALINSGTGTLTVLTTNDNFGAITINAGTVQFGDGTSAGSMQGFQIVNNGALVFKEPTDITNVAAISGSGPLTKLDTNNLTLSSNSTYTNLTTAKGTLTVGVGGLGGGLASPVNLVADITPDGLGGFLTNLATLVFNETPAITQTNISGNGNLANYGNGTVTLTASNSYTGDTIFGNGTSSGHIVQGVAGAIPGGAGFGNIIGASGNDSLDLNGFNTSINLISGNGFVGNDGPNAGSSTVTLTIGVNGASSVAAQGGVMRDHATGSGILRVVKVGAGSQNLSGGNSFTGGLRVEGGEANIRNNNGTGGNANTVEMAGGSLRIANNITFNSPGIITVTSNTLVAMEGIWVINGQLAGPSTSTLTFSNPASGRLDWGSTMNGSTFSGTIKFTDNSGGNIRNVNQNGWTGSPNITFDLGNGSVFIGPRNRSLIMDLGALIGGPNTALNAGSSSDQINDPNIYVIGGKNLNTLYQGSINDSSPVNGAPRLTKIRKVGTGTLTLSGSMNYTAGMTISNGVLVLTTNAYLHEVAVFTNAFVGAPGFQNPTNFALTIFAPGILDVSAETAGPNPGGVTLGDPAINSSNVTQIIQGNGTINGSLLTLGNALVAPGISSSYSTPALGTFTVTNTLSLGGTTLMKLNRAGSPNSDRLVANSITNGGTLIVTNIGATLVSGDTFQLLSAPSHTGAFASVSLPPLSGGLSWSNALATSGNLTVVGSGGVNTARTNITVSVSGKQLTLSWPADHIGWRLQVQTNSLSVGIVTNASSWFDVAGSTSVGTNVFTINPANGTVFYRMVYP